MVRKARHRSSKGFTEKALKKGEARKLNALRKSLGKDIAEKAFAEWYQRSANAEQDAVDRNAAAIAEALTTLVKTKNIRIPRGGYRLRRGRGRVIVEPGSK